jgi:hypothetical protein
MKPIREAWAFASTLLVLVPACSGGSRAPTLQEGCSAYENIWFERQAACLGVTPVSDQATLTARATKSCVLFSGGAGSRVNGQFWKDCADQMNNDCGGYNCGYYPPGARQSGEPCLDSTQCASLFCKGTVVTDASGNAISKAVQCGVCADRLPAAAVCNVATDACDIGMSCFDGTCRAQGRQGAPCAHWSDCAFPWICNGTGSCTYALSQGSPCISSLDCTTDQACDVTTRVCAPVRFAPPGAFCDGEVNDCESGSCNRGLGVCPAVLADGAPCDPNDFSKVCDVVASCFDGTCSIPDPAACK